MELQDMRTIQPETLRHFAHTASGSKLAIKQQEWCTYPFLLWSNKKQSKVQKLNISATFYMISTQPHWSVHLAIKILLERALRQSISSTFTFSHSWLWGGKWQFYCPTYSEIIARPITRCQTSFYSNKMSRKNNQLNNPYLMSRVFNLGNWWGNQSVTTNTIINPRWRNPSWSDPCILAVKLSL
jgi:hypothetical protein